MTTNGDLMWRSESRYRCVTSSKIISPKLTRALPVVWYGTPTFERVNQIVEQLSVVVSSTEAEYTPSLLRRQPQESSLRSRHKRHRPSTAWRQIFARLINQRTGHLDNRTGGVRSAHDVQWPRMTFAFVIFSEFFGGHFSHYIPWTLGIFLESFLCSSQHFSLK